MVEFSAHAKLSNRRRQMIHRLIKGLSHLKIRKVRWKIISWKVEAGFIDKLKPGERGGEMVKGTGKVHAKMKMSK